MDTEIPDERLTPASLADYRLFYSHPIPTLSRPSPSLFRPAATDVVSCSKEILSGMRLLTTR